MQCGVWTVKGGTGQSGLTCHCIGHCAEQHNEAQSSVSNHWGPQREKLWSSQSAHIADNVVVSNTSANHLHWTTMSQWKVALCKMSGRGRRGSYDRGGHGNNGGRGSVRTSTRSRNNNDNNSSEPEKQNSPLIVQAKLKEQCMTQWKSKSHVTLGANVNLGMTHKN